MPLRQDVLDNPCFWALLFGYGLGQIGDAPEIDSVCSLLAVRPGDVEKWSNSFTGFGPDALLDSDGFLEDPSYICVVLANQVSIHVEFHPGDIYWQVADDRTSASLTLANIGGHWVLPGLRWQEAAAIRDVASRFSPSTSNVLLLMLPVVWLTVDDDANLTREAVELAWTSSGLVSASSAFTLANLWMQAVAGGSSYHWQLTQDRGWVTDANWSSRGMQRRSAEVNAINQLLAKGLA